MIRAVKEFAFASVMDSGGLASEDIFPPGSTMQVLDTVDDTIIGEHIFKDLKEASSVDGAMYSFTDFQVEEETISQVLKAIKKTNKAVLRFVVDFSQSQGTYAIYPKLKKIANEAYRIAGKGGSLGGQSLPGIMHLKLWLIVLKDGTKVLYVGSANASGSASGSQPINYETMLRFTVPGEAKNSVFDIYQKKFEELLERAKKFEKKVEEVGEEEALKQWMEPKTVQSLEFGVQSSNSQLATRLPTGQAGNSQLSENFLGFRKIRGLIHKADLARRIAFNASGEEIIRWIADKYNISRGDLEVIAHRFEVKLNDRKSWLRISDELEKLNFQQFSSLDSKKYKEGQRAGILGWVLILGAGIAYGYGYGIIALGVLGAAVGLAAWKVRGILREETLGLHKRLIGFAVRFPYHLFDMFLFGYFRRNISYHFLHPKEDFLNLTHPGSAAKYLEHAIRERGLKEEGRGILYHPVSRGIQRYFWIPFLQPLLQFVTRRTSLAFFSTMGMGILGGASPFIPLDFHLVSVALPGISTALAVASGLGGVALLLGRNKISGRWKWALGLAGLGLLAAGLGPTMTFLAHGIPLAASSVPFVGGALSSISSVALQALLKDMLLGPLLNTLILSTLLTLPRAVWQQVIKERHDMIASGSPPPVDLAALLHVGGVVLNTFFNPRHENFRNFWKQNAFSFVGLLTVGAEIEGIMQYMGNLDGALSHLTGLKVGVFHAVGAAIERPAEWQDAQGNLHRNVVPIGGAINWGNVLLYKFQSALGFNLADTALGFTSRVLNAAHPNSISAALVPLADQFSSQPPSSRGDSLAAQLVSVGQTSPADKEQGFKEKLAQSGNLKQEIERTKLRIQSLQKELMAAQVRLKEVKGQTDLIPKEIQEKYDQDLKSLKAKRDELYTLSKLSQKTDLKNPVLSSEQLKALDSLIAGYEGVLAPSSEGSAYLKSKELALASLKGLVAKLFEDRNDGNLEVRNEDVPEHPKEKEIKALIEKIEDLSSGVQDQVALRDAVAKLLSVASQERSKVLKERRAGKEMLGFRKELSKWSMVTDLSFAKKELDSAKKAIQGMLHLLDSQKERVEKQRQSNTQNQEQAKDNLGRMEEWRQKSRDNIAEDDQWVSDLAILLEQAQTASQRISEFRQDMSALLSMLDARDKNSSPDASSEYQRRLDLMGPATDPNSLAYKRIHGYPGTDPNDVNKLSLKVLNDNLKKVNDSIQSINSGLEKLETVPLEFVGVVMREVLLTAKWDDSKPLLVNLNNAKAHFEKEVRDFQTIQTNVSNMLDPNFSGTTVDDFGDARPTSLIRFHAQEQQKLDQAKNEIQTYTGEMDSIAQSISQRVPGISLPLLSGKSAQDLRVLLPQYADLLETLQFPKTAEGDLAKLDKMALARLLAKTGEATVRWIVSEKTVEVVSKHINQTLPIVKPVIESVVVAEQSMSDLVDAYIQFANQGSPLDQAQAVLDKTRDVLKGISPTLQEAKTLLEGTVIPLQQEAVDQVDPAKGENFVTLYAEKLKLYNDISKAYNRTVPWGLASLGAPEGDIQKALANIADQQEQFVDYQDRVKALLDEAALRKDPNYNATEEVFGENMPYSLPQRLVQYEAEKNQRAPEINAKGGEINTILAQVDERTGGKYHLIAENKLPTDIQASDSASLDLILDLLESGKLTDLADKLRDIADEMQKTGGSVDLNGDGGLIKTGDQPPPELNNAQRVALLALDAVRRLVPTPENRDSSSLTFSMIRFLFSDAVVVASRKALDERIPESEVFLEKAQGVLVEALQDLQKDAAYVQSNPPSETGAQVFERKVNIYDRVYQIAGEGKDFFGVKKGWDEGGLESLEDIQQYHEGLRDIYGSGNEALDAEETALNAMREALQKTLEDLGTQEKNIATWLSQLNDPKESAMRRVSNSLSVLQEKTRKLLEENIDYKLAEKQFEAADKTLSEKMEELSKAHRDLSAALKALPNWNVLSPELLEHIEKISSDRKAWLLSGGKDQPEVLVIRKSHFETVLTQLLSVFDPASSTQDIKALKEQILKSPNMLASLIPDSRMLQLGEGEDGFYLVYQSDLSVPYGLQTSNQVTLGNVAKLLGQNISVTGYRFGSPPNSLNAPWGDQGVSVTVESIKGSHWVNYLNVTFHRFIQDIPKDISVPAQAQENRLMIFDDFAVMLLGDRLYVAGTGFGDFSPSDSKKRTYYYGANLKTSVKFTKVASLTAEESRLFAKDPREFFQKINLDFTGFNEDLNQDFLISAKGDNKQFIRHKAGVNLNLQEAFETQNTFLVDFFLSQVESTDDFAQKSLGTTVLKGFSLGGDAIMTSKTTGELGQEFNTLSQGLTLDLPKQGIVLGAEGKILGSADTYFVELSKKLGKSVFSISYGSPYVGANKRLTLGSQSLFTVGDLWRTVTHKSVQNLQGGEILSEHNAELEDFFNHGTQGSPSLQEIKRVYEQSIAKKLLTQKIGEITQELQPLIQSGAILNNLHVRGMVGFTTNAVGEHISDRAVGGGPQAGAVTELTLTRSQKALMENKSAQIVALGLELQSLYMDLTRQWQETVMALAQAQWEARLAEFMILNAQDETLRAQAVVEQEQAFSRLRQAAIQYNMLTGRGPSASIPKEMQGLSSQDLSQLMSEVGRSMKDPQRLTQLFQTLDAEELDIPKPGVNVAGWIPFIEKLTFQVGTQIQDFMGNHVFGFGLGVAVPVYDPHSKEKDKALKLENKAKLQEISALYEKYYQASGQAQVKALVADSQRQLLGASQMKTAQALSKTIVAYRNGLISQNELWQAFRTWAWYTDELLTAQAQQAFQESLSAMYKGVGSQNSQLATLNSQLSLGERSQAASLMMEAVNHRISKIGLEIRSITNLTSSGVGWIPNVSLTGFGILPILIPSFELTSNELRELQVQEQKGRLSYYQNLEAKVKMDVTLKIFQNYATYKMLGEMIEVYRNQRIPELEKSGNSWELDQEKIRLLELEGSRKQTQQILNSLMGRPLETPISTDVSLSQAWAELLEYLKSRDAVQVWKNILSSRVEITQAVEGVVDGNLKKEKIRLDIVNVVGRQVTKLFGAWSGSPTASPELVQQARVETLQAERDLDAFEKQLPVELANIRHRLSLMEQEIQSLEGKTDSQSRLLKLELQAAVLILESQLQMLKGQEEEPAETAQPLPGDSAAVPSSYVELKDRLIQSHLAKSFPGRISEPSPSVDLGVSDHFGISSYVRDYRLKTSLGKDPIHRAYVESWIEWRLKSPEASPSQILALSKLEKEKSDRDYRTVLMDAKVRAERLLSQFQMHVLLWRGVKESPKSYVLSPKLEKKLSEEAQQIVAHIGLAPKTTWRDLAQLIPEEALDFQPMVQSLESIHSALFQEGFPRSLSQSEEDKISQIKANIVAEQFSIKGFTPILVDGFFRGQHVSGAFLEAPDPVQIEKALGKVLGDALVGELKSKGQFQGLVLKTHSLMASVFDKARLLEKHGMRVAAAENNLKSHAVLLEKSWSKAEDVAAAEEELFDAWSDFSDTVIGLKLDFNELVSDLEAMGYPSGVGSRELGVGSPEFSVENSQAPIRLLAKYWASRMRDPDFARVVDQLLGQQPGAAELATELKSSAEEYRNMFQNAEKIRYANIPASEKTELLIQTDAEGRKQDVEQILEKVLAQWKDWGSLYEFLKSDLESQGIRAAQDLNHQRQIFLAMRNAYWHAFPIPWGIEGAYKQLGEAWSQKEISRQALLEQSLSVSQSPAEFIIRDILLDEYLKIQTAYDQQIIRTFNSKEVKGNPLAAKTLDQLFDFKESVERQKDLLKYGRGMLAIRALIELGNIQLEALRWQRAGPSEISEAALTVKQLEELRDRWLKNPRELQPLYVATKVDGQGNRTWSVGQWLTPKDLEGLSKAGRVVSAEGRLWLLPEGSSPVLTPAALTLEDVMALKADEILSGIDLKSARMEENK
ncbi:MAG: hypothetical protein HY400_06590, partial [Elusimicrobia bacterium]|nr:hypothetical protein [Elusimicrobiota bacterium]